MQDDQIRSVLYEGITVDWWSTGSSRGAYPRTCLWTRAAEVRGRPEYYEKAEYNFGVLQWSFDRLYTMQTSLTGTNWTRRRK